MTDERQGSGLWSALAALPRGSGIIVRHYSLEPKERQRLIAKIRYRARRGGLTMVLAGSEREGIAAKADGFHRRSAHIGDRHLIRTIAVHNRRELSLAHRAKADLVFISSLFETKSHPDTKILGRVRFGLLANHSHIPVIALGGMDAKRAASLKSLGIYGWAAIGALTPKNG